MTVVCYTTEVVLFSLKETSREVPKLQGKGPVFFQESPNKSLKSRRNFTVDLSTIYMMTRRGCPVSLPACSRTAPTLHFSRVSCTLHWLSLLLWLKAILFLQGSFLVRSVDRYNSPWDGTNIKARGKGERNTWLATWEGRRTTLSLLSTAETEIHKHKTEIIYILFPSITKGNYMHCVHHLQL